MYLGLILRVASLVVEESYGCSMFKYVALNDTNEIDLCQTTTNHNKVWALS